jgi:hypothetical protein
MPPFVIPPVIGWALGTLGAAVIVRIAAREWRRVNAVLHPREPAPEPVVRDTLPTLKRDPASGVYRLE